VKEKYVEIKTKEQARQRRVKRRKRKERERGEFFLWLQPHDLKIKISFSMLTYIFFMNSSCS
jgi:hypothetical protein